MRFDRLNSFPVKNPGKMFTVLSVGTGNYTGQMSVFDSADYDRFIPAFLSE
jgi:hypothetical protein